MEELLVLVNDNDEEIGYEEKGETHAKGKLHRAFSLFIYNKFDGKMLIQKRAKGKYHSGGLWTNSCCSHPRKGESLVEAVKRRTNEELGLRLENNDLIWSQLCELKAFEYFHKFENCAEYEIDHVFFLPVDSDNITLDPDKNEIEEVKWIYVAELQKWLDKQPGKFTVWFPEAFKIVCDNIRLDGIGT